MGYDVRITQRAERDLAELFDEKQVANSPAALRWYRGLRKAVLSLEEMPDRCPVAPEGRKLRHLLYGGKPHVYRIIFQIEKAQSRVNILHIRHAARLPAKIIKTQ